MIVPILALVGFGTWFVLQEQRLARQEAIDSLQQSGTEFTEHLEATLPLIRWIQETHRSSELAPATWPEKVLTFSVDANGESVTPPIPKQPPLPTPGLHPWGRLNETLTLLWAKTHRATNTTERLKLAESFLAAQPPAPFAVLMGITKISSLIESYRVAPAQAMIEQLRADYPEPGHSEAGIPLSVLLDLQELQIVNQRIAAGKEAHDLLWRFGRRQLSHPTSWTRQILQHRITPNQLSPRCQQIQAQLLHRLDRIEDAQILHASLPPSEWQRWMNSAPMTPRWIDSQGSRFFVHPLPSSGRNQDFVAITQDGLAEDCRNAFASMPAGTEFQYAVSIRGQPVFPKEDAGPHPSAPEPADALHALVPSAAYPWLQARITLATPESFFARSRQRTRSLLLLMILASSTGLVGWLAQRAAFRRQVALGQMKSNFVASVSHELRAPIASIRLMGENLQSPNQAHQEQQKDYLKWISLECARLSALVENVLQFSRLETGRSNYTFEPVDIHKLFEETLRLMKPIAANADVALAWDLPAPDSTRSPAKAEAEWDGQAVHQALVNLVDNAIKHTPTKGTVNAYLDLTTDPRRATFTITDQGPGIPEADRDRIFSPFERLGSEETRRTKGVGIGLSLVQHTAQAHGGQVTIHDAKAKGSCFLLSLPLKPNLA